MRKKTNGRELVAEAARAVLADDARVATTRKVKKPRGMQAGSRVDKLARISVGATMTEAVHLRCQYMQPKDIDDQALLIRSNLSAVVIRATRANPGNKYTINTGFFRTAAGDFVVAGVVTRLE